MKTIFLTAVLLLLTGAGWGTERHVTPTADGDLLGDDGKPVFLISTSVKIHIFDTDYEKNYPLFKKYPEWLYGEGYAPGKFSLFEKIGFNSLNFFGTTLSLRALDPDYNGFDKATQWSAAQEFYRRYELDKLGKRGKLPSAKAWKEYDELAVNATAKIPVYLDLHPGLQSVLTSQRDAVRKLLSPEKLFAAPDQHPVFALRFKLCDPEARELQKRLYVDQAQHYLSTGVKPFVYKLFNEADYKDDSPENFRAFIDAMRKQYGGSIGRLNAAWRTKYASFDCIATKPGEGGKAKEIEYKKFLERQIADFTGELRDALRTVDPEAVVLSQVHSGAWRASWNNFNQYLINKHTGYVSFGTGNYTFSAGVDVEENGRFGECGNNNSPREYLARAAFYRALADGKPLLSTEAYIAGFGERYLPFKKAFWHEMILGSSMLNLWEWGGYWAPWIAPNIGYMLHHPKCVTPESWRAVPETLREFERTAEFFQRRANRPKASVAVLFSYPTLRANQPRTEGFVRGVNAAQLRNIPVDAIFEEQLGEGRQERYRAIIAFGVENLYQETVGHLREFVKRGGTLITDAESLRRDEYGFPLKENLLAGLNTVPGSNTLQSRGETGMKFIDSTAFDPLGAGWASLLEDRGKPLMVKKLLGKGTLVALSGSWQDCALSQVLAPVFAGLELRPTAEVKRFGSDGLAPYIGAYKGTHNGMTGWYFVNYTSRPALVRVAAEELKNAVAVNFIDRCSYPVDGDAVVLLIPAQYHLVMITGPKAKVENALGAFAPVTPEILKESYDEQIDRLNREAYVRPSEPVDLRAVANYGFDNQQGWKTPTAWFDAETQNLVGVPWHGQVFHRVNFDLIRFDFNDNRTCVALKSKHLPEAPEKTADIVLNEKLRGVAFLHAATHGKPGETAMTYHFTYEDGSSADVPVVVGREIGDWKIETNSPEVQSMCAWKSQEGRGFFLYEWNNPQPSKTLKSVSVLSGNGESVPIVAAISALPTRFRKEYGNRIDLVNAMTKCSAKKTGNGIQPDGSLVFNREQFTLSTPGRKPVALPKDKINSAVLRFQLVVRPDEWGKLSVFNPYLWGSGLLGICGGDKEAKTWPDHRVSLVAEAFVHAFRENKNYSDPVEVELGLEVMNEASGKPFDAVYGITLAFDSSNVLIRDLRIEY